MLSKADKQFLWDTFFTKEYLEKSFPTKGYLYEYFATKEYLEKKFSERLTYLETKQINVVNQ